MNSPAVNTMLTVTMSEKAFSQQISKKRYNVCAMKNLVLSLAAANKQRSMCDTVGMFKQLQHASPAECAKLKEQILLSNLGLVVAGCKRFFSFRDIDVDDLLQEGIVGLQVAIEKYDVTRGTQFSTCAYWWIKQKVRRYLEHQTMDNVRSNSVDIDAPISDDSDSKTLGEMLPAPDASAEARDTAEKIALVKKIADEVLDKRERAILAFRYGI